LRRSPYRAPKVATVTLSSKNQVVIPQEARKKLGVGPGARLLVLVKDDRIVLMPEPRDFVKHSTGCHKGLWRKGYLARERRAWRR
jgi:AbrB family looped-hinge helix DNA binding protein